MEFLVLSLFPWLSTSFVQVLNMLCCWVEDPHSEAFKLHIPRIYDYLWLAEDGMKMQVHKQFQISSHWHYKFYFPLLFSPFMKVQGQRICDIIYMNDIMGIRKRQSFLCSIEEWFLMTKERNMWKGKEQKMHRKKKTKIAINSFKTCNTPFFLSFFKLEIQTFHL